MAAGGARILISSHSSGNSMNTQTSGRQSALELILILGTLSAFTPLTIDMYLPALPDMGRLLHATPGQLQQTLSVFFFGIAAGQLFYGPISDRYGRRLPLFAGILVFIVASAACAMATDIETLIVARFAQALGCCAAYVLFRAMVRDLFVPHEGARVLSMLMLVMGIAPIIAPIIGAYIIVWLDWRTIFWVLGAFALAALITCHFRLPETHTGPKASLSLGSVLKNYMELLTQRRFMAYTLAVACTLGGLFGYIAGSPFVFIEYFNLSPQAYSWVFGLNALGIMGAAQANRMLLRRVSLDQGVIIGIAIQAISACIMIILSVFQIGGFLGLWIPIFLYLTGQGFVLPNATASAMASEAHRAGTAAALMGMLQFVFGAIASGLVGLLHDGTTLSLAAVVGLMGLCALGTRLLLIRSGP